MRDWLDSRNSPTMVGRGRAQADQTSDQSHGQAVVVYSSDSPWSQSAGLVLSGLAVVQKAN